MYLRVKPSNSQPELPGIHGHSLDLPAQVRGSWPSDAERLEAQKRLEAWLEQERSRRTLSGSDGRIDVVQENLDGFPSCQYRYNQQGDLVEIIEADGRRTGYEYDDQRRLVCVRFCDGGAAFYRYCGSRLVEVEDRGQVRRFTFSAEGLLDRMEFLDSSAFFRYNVPHSAASSEGSQPDQPARLIEARHVSDGRQDVICRWEYDSAGRVAALSQEIGGAVLAASLTYDAQGRLVALRLPGLNQALRYTWDERGRPATIALGDLELGSYRFDDEHKQTTLSYANGLVNQSQANLHDGRPKSLAITRAGEVVLQRKFMYGLGGEVLSDGRWDYSYDILGRLIAAAALGQAEKWEYQYDALDNRTAGPRQPGRSTCYIHYDAQGCLLETGDPQAAVLFRHDRWGRLAGQTDAAAGREWSYRYDGAGRLSEAFQNGHRCARFTYDFKGRLALADYADYSERYFYGPADELLAVTDLSGQPQYLFVRTPLGVLAELHFTSSEDGAVPRVYFRHDDPQGSALLLSDMAGSIVKRFDYCPFGAPSGELMQEFVPFFQGRRYCATLGLYYFGARWYDPTLGRFLTPDSYTGAPDDERLVNPYISSSRQVTQRLSVLNEWLKQPRLRNRYVFCANDPAGRVDPNGHWSFGGVLLSLLGAIWTLPNTLFGLLIEVTCLIGEVVRWLVWLVSFGNASWETPGFDAAASGRLNAFALVFSGGWLGSFSSLLGITFGNVFFVYKQWETSSHITSMSDPVFPTAYGGSVSIPRSQALYEHELRHTNQYGWFGPFFHLGLPLFGFYEWDVIINGYRNAWSERDAREHAEEDPAHPTPRPAPGTP